MSGRATLATARLRLATPATPISVASTSPPQRTTAAARRSCGPRRAPSRPPLDLIQVPLGPRLWSGVAPTALSQPQDSWMWPQTASRGALLLDRREQRLAAEVRAGVAAVAVALAAANGGRGPRPRAPGRASRRGLLVERSKLQSQGVSGTPAPRPKNSTPSIVVPSPCRTVAAAQPARRAAQRVDASRCCRGPGRSASRSAPGPDRLLQPLVDRGEVAGPDHHVGVGRHLDQRGRLPQVPVQVAEGEQLHARGTYPLVCPSGE